MKTIALIAAAVLAGCGADSDSDETAPAAALDATVLTSRSLGSSSLPELQLLSSERGRDLLSHVVSCALPHGATITAINRDGMPYSFTGELGLAPGWADHAPTGVERQRVSDCLRTQAGAAVDAAAATAATAARTTPAA